jgi:cytochrome oxidase Cu insertion factor (SCO1/SenC/PrrC family)
LGKILFLLSVGDPDLFERGGAKMRVSTHPSWLPASLLSAVMVMGTPAVTAAQQNPGKDADANTTNHPWIGDPAPDFRLTSTRGQPVALTDFKGGKFLVIHFAASW